MQVNHFFVKRGRLSEAKCTTMGSFSSKARAVRNEGRNCGDLHEGEITISGGVEDEVLSITDDSEIMEDSMTQEQGEGANGGESSSADTRHQQHTASRINHSFSWLASPPVVFNAIANVQKGKGKPFIERGSKSSNVMIYSNGKYLKSWQHSAEFSSSVKTERKPQRDVGSFSTSTADDNGKFAANEDRDKKGHKEKNVSQLRTERGNVSHLLSSRAGFGLLPQ